MWIWACWPYLAQESSWCKVEFSARKERERERATKPKAYQQTPKVVLACFVDNFEKSLWHVLEFLNRDEVAGLNVLWEKLFIKRSLACHILEIISKVGWNFWDLLFLPLKLWENLGFEIGYEHGTHGPSHPMQGWLSPPILVGQLRRLIFNSPTPLFVYDNLSIKKFWLTLCLILMS